MKQFILSIMMLSLFTFANAQSDWQKEMESLSANMGKEITKFSVDLTKKKKWTEEDRAKFNKEMANLQASLSKELKKFRKDFPKEEFSKDFSMIFSDKEMTFNFGTNDTPQFQGDMFEKLADIKGVEVIYISKSLLGMMPNMNMPGVDIGNVAGKLQGLQIYSAEQKNAVKALKNESDKLLKNGKYETVMFVKDDDSKTVFYLKKISNKQSEMLMVTEEPKEIKVIRFLGNFSMQDIQELTKNHNGKN